MDRDRILKSRSIYLILAGILIIFTIASIFIRIFTLPIITLLGYLFFDYVVKHYRRTGLKKEAEKMDEIRRSLSRTLKWSMIISFIGMIIVGFITVLTII